MSECVYIYNQLAYSIEKEGKMDIGITKILHLKVLYIIYFAVRIE
jgi:hypothetical protein